MEEEKRGETGKERRGWRMEEDERSRRRERGRNGERKGREQEGAEYSSQASFITRHIDSQSY